MYHYCLADIAEGLFTGMISNYLLHFFQPTAKIGILVVKLTGIFAGILNLLSLVAFFSAMTERLPKQ